MSTRRIALYCRELDEGGAGAAEYARQMTRAIYAHRDPRVELVIVGPQASREEFAGVEYVSLPATHRLAQDHWHAPRILNRLACDVVWLPKNVVPYGLRCRSVVAFLDLAYFIPDLRAYPSSDTWYMRRMFRRSARKARHVAAISEQTRRDAIALLGISPERISVAYPAVSPMYRPIADEGERARVADRHRLPSEFILYAGALTPRKNLPRLLRAFASIQDRIPHDLVLTGPIEWDSRDIRGAIAAGGSRVHRLGRVATADMPALYSLAACYAHPSLYEGFGLPLVEAQACGTPVLTSKVSCMPEVAGEGALLVDPYDEQSIASGLIRICTDRSLRDDLVKKGLANAQRFSGAIAAARMQEILLRVADE